MDKYFLIAFTVFLCFYSFVFSLYDTEMVDMIKRKKEVKQIIKKKLENNSSEEEIYNTYKEYNFSPVKIFIIKIMFSLIYLIIVFKINNFVKVEYSNVNFFVLGNINDICSDNIIFQSIYLTIMLVIYFSNNIKKIKSKNNKEIIFVAINGILIFVGYLFTTRKLSVFLVYAILTCYILKRLFYKLILYKKRVTK